MDELEEFDWRPVPTVPDPEVEPAGREVEAPDPEVEPAGPEVEPAGPEVEAPRREAALDRALGDAYRHLAMRDRTEAEIRRCLGRRGHAAEVADGAVAELRHQGYLDDARFARRFAEDRRTLDGWGLERIRVRLAELGVAGDLVEACCPNVPEDELAAAVDVLRRRLLRTPRDERERQRALGLLVRRGFELELAYDAVRQFERSAA